MCGILRRRDIIFVHSDLIFFAEFLKSRTLEASLPDNAKANEYELPQSHTTYQPTTPRGRATEH